MRKKITWGLLILLAVVLIIGGNYASKALPIANGFAAKTVCSCKYLSNRSVESVQQNELLKLPYVNIEVNEKEQFVETNAFGFFKRKAIFREGIGCTLLFDEDYEKLDFSYQRKQVSDTLGWPFGSNMDSAYASFQYIDYAMLNSVIQKEFEEQDTTNKKRARGLVIVHKGKIIAEEYGDGFDAASRQTGWSMTKSIVNALVGITVKKYGLNIKEKIGGKYWSDERANITWDHLLRMSTNLDFEE